jgi:DHA2 family multidrug resistance protein-like MFS transporter
MNETSAEFGFALGIALLGSLGTGIYRAQIAGHMPAAVPADAAAAARDNLAAATTAARHLPGPPGAALLAACRDAFTSGLHTVAGISAILLAVVAILAVILLRHVRPIGQTQPDQPGQPDRIPTANGPCPGLTTTLAPAPGNGQPADNLAPAMPATIGRTDDERRMPCARQPCKCM